MLEIIKNALTQIFASYSQYAGSGMYMLLFFLAMVCIYIWERNKQNRALLYYYPLITLVVIYNPLIAHIIIVFIEGQVYWRIFWLLPTTIIIAYAATVIVLNVHVKLKKILVTVALIAILIVGGKFIFIAENYSKASNWYKLPTQTILVCDILEKDTDEVIRVVVPTGLEVSMRQYNANIQIVYGVDMQSMNYYMYALNSNYIVLDNTVNFSGKLEDYGYQIIGATDSYNIYRFKLGGMTDSLRVIQ